MNYSLQVRECDVATVIESLKYYCADFEIKYLLAPIANPIERKYLVYVNFSDDIPDTFGLEERVAFFQEINATATDSIVVILTSFDGYNPITFYLDGSPDRFDELIEFISHVKQV